MGNPLKWGVKHSQSVVDSAGQPQSLSRNWAVLYWEMWRWTKRWESATSCVSCPLCIWQEGVFNQSFRYWQHREGKGFWPEDVRVYCQHIYILWWRYLEFGARCCFWFSAGQETAGELEGLTAGTRWVYLLFGSWLTQIGNIVYMYM